jgi:acyl carrier protein
MLIQLADDVHRFIWSHHHLLLDGWSLSLVLKEVLNDYEALCRGESPNAIARRPYADYIAWLRQQDLAQAEAFWRQTLKGFRKPTTLGVPVYDTARLYDYRHMLMPAEIMSTLRRVARQHRITVNAFVRGAWALVLSRYSGESDVVFGATVSGRSAPLNDIESMVGLFINTIPVRVKVATDDSLIPWLKQLQAQQFEAQPYEYISLTQLQAWSEVPRGLPLFESNVVFENAPFDGNLLDRKEGLRVEDHLYLEQAHYPLSVVVMPGRRMFVRIIYDCRRFDAVTVDRMLEHLKVLLTQMAVQSEIRITGVEGQVVRTPEAAFDTTIPKSDVAYVAPRTSVEEMTVNIWSEVLGIERVGVNDNFFDLGGHSLLAISVLSRVRNEFQIELQLRSIVDAPTPAELAMVIIQHLAEGIDDLQVQQILQELESVEAH